MELIKNIMGNTDIVGAIIIRCRLYPNTSTTVEIIICNHQGSIQ